MMRRFAAGVMVSALLGSLAVADPIDECGFIAGDQDCRFFIPLSAESHMDFAIDIPGFPDSLVWTPIRAVGNTVFCGRVCDGIWSLFCIVDYELLPCEPQDLGCGVLSRSSSPSVNEFCWVWTSAVHGSFITPPHGYAVGDTVHVVGIVDQRSASTCVTVDGFLWNEVLTDCPDTLSRVESTTWGTLKDLFR